MCLCPEMQADHYVFYQPKTNTVYDQEKNIEMMRNKNNEQMIEINIMEWLRGGMVVVTYLSARYVSTGSDRRHSRLRLPVKLERLLRTLVAICVDFGE